MPVPFAINGLGRIGRALVRIAAGRDDLELVAVNDLEPAAALAPLLARDSVHGPFPGGAGRVAAWDEGEGLVIDGRPVPVFAEREPGAIPWAGTGARVVVEATGEHLDRERAAGHLGGPVERVVVSANAPGVDVTLCLGINDGAFDPARHRVVSNASCTTNCLAPLLDVLDRTAGVERATMLTVHPYTHNQRLLDGAHPDPRRARAAALNAIPTPTTAPRAVGELLPRLAGRVEGLAVRVPTPAVAILELAAQLATDATRQALADAFAAAAAAGGRLAGILAVSDQPLVSSDFVGSPYSAVVDLPLLAVADRRLARVVAWYDNEWGYASRLADLVARIGGPAAAAGDSDPGR